MITNAGSVVAVVARGKGRQLLATASLKLAAANGTIATRTSTTRYTSTGATSSMLRRRRGVGQREPHPRSYIGGRSTSDTGQVYACSHIVRAAGQN